MKYNCFKGTAHSLYGIIRQLKKNRDYLHRVLTSDHPKHRPQVPKSREPYDMIVYGIESWQYQFKKDPDRDLVLVKVAENRKYLRTASSLANFIHTHSYKTAFMLFHLRDKMYILSEVEYEEILRGLGHYLPYRTWHFLEHRIIDNKDYLLTLIV